VFSVVQNNLALNVEKTKIKDILYHRGIRGFAAQRKAKITT
jgi:hypothetical protein